MISALLASFGMLYPVALTGLPIVAGALVYAYLRRGRGRRVTVASLLLLAQLRQRAPARRRFIPPIRFIFELLLLSLLLFGVAGLYRRAAGDTVAIVVDTSLSMAARISTDALGATPLQRTRAAVEELVASGATHDQYELFVTSPTLRSLNGTPVAAREIRTALAGVEAVAADDNLGAVLDHFAAADKFDRVIIFTDQQATVDPKSGGDPRISLRTLVSPAERREMHNVAIVGIERTRSLAADESEVAVTVTGFGVTRENVRVVLGAIPPPEGAGEKNFSLEEARAARTDRRTLGERTVILKDGVPEIVRFSGVRQGYETVSARVERTRPEFRDAINVDNAAYLSSDERATTVEVVSDLDIQALGLARVASAKFVHRSVNEYQSKYENAVAPPGERSATVIFHRYVPRALPPTNALFVMPEVGSPLIAVASESRNVAVTRSLASHPLVTYLNLSVVTFPILRVLQLPSWGEALIMTTAGIAAYAGSVQERRYAVFGFEIFPYEGKKSPLLSILLLNSLKWLADLNTNSGFVTVPTTLRNVTEVHRIDSSGDDSSDKGEKIASVADGSATIDTPGIYVTHDGTGLRRTLAANFFNEHEFDVSRDTFVRIPEPGRRTEHTPFSEAERNLAGRIAIIALVALLIDWSIIFLRSVRRRRMV